MDSLWVYDNWTTDRARVHRGDCADCNHGRGKMARPSAQHGRWRGPFYDREEAFEFARGLTRSEVVACSKCKP